jgi:glycosyltransferase involved in cell wall biosynthesis
VLQLPPPLHGASVMNRFVVESTKIRQHYDLDVIPLRYANGLADIGRPSIRKASIMVGQLAGIFCRTLMRRPDAIYYTIAPTGWALIRDLAFVSIFKAARIRLVFHIHGRGIGLAAQRRLLRTWIRWTFRNEIVIHLSPTLAVELEGLVERDRWKILPNGIPGPSGGADYTLKGPGPPKIVFCSNMMIEKGPLILVEALGVLNRRGVAFTAEFAGPSVHKEFEDVFRLACRREGILERVSWTGARYGLDKAEMLRSADVFAFPTYYASEGVPLVLLEAMSYGLPSVVTDQGGIRDVIEDGVTGYIVPPRDAECLAERLERLVLDHGRRELMGGQARVAFRNRFTVSSFEEGLVGILDEAIL